MKKYQFRLAQVQRVRAVEEEQAKAALLEANRNVQRAIDLVQQRMDAYQASSGFVGGSVNNAILSKNRHFADLAGRAVMVAHEARLQADAVATEKHIAWMEAATKLKALERLDERKREEYAIEAQREEDRVLDDITVGRFTSTQSEIAAGGAF